MNYGREALVGPRIVVDDKILEHHSVLVREGFIEAVVPASELPSDVPVRELGSGILTAGLVDIHTHGAAGWSFNDGDVEGNKEALRTLLRAGITTVLPSLTTAPIEDITRGLKALGAVQNATGLPRTPGAHLEGPYFAYAQRGGQDPDSLRNPADGSTSQLLEYADVIRMISFAPELPGAVQLTERLVANGIIAAAGHSDGRDTDLRACQEAGLSHVIHIYSGQSTTVRDGPWRSPGMLEATLASDGLTVEMIADGKHLPDGLMTIAHRCLQGRLCLVSDSTPGAGMPEGSRYRMGNMEYMVEDGVGMTLDRTGFGGSTTLVSQMIPIAMKALGIGLPEAVAMATTIPAAATGLTLTGRIAPGYYADFALLDDQLRPTAVALSGKWQSG